jgi:4-amino-4-deoxy-L-arabinose transferase-like glycosyltransferase
MSTLPLRASAPPRSRARAVPFPPPELSVLLLLLAASLYLWTLSRNGYANEYYAAAVRAMSESWHAFLYGSFDSAGVMTVDKPPLALWVQALTARAFGFGPLALLVPQALMGVATVGLVYDLVRRRFGRAGGFAAGLALALTPITVAIARHNNPDALTILCCTGALWCLVRALEDGRTRWLVASGALVGLGFEAKMAVALMVVPGIAAAWLWVAPRGRAAAVRALLAGGAALVVVGGAWPLLLALTPAGERPWISGTGDDSILSLILGYNGLGRLAGQAGGPAAAGFVGGGVFGGDAGVWRLLNASLGGQAGWLLGFALAGAIAIVAASRLGRSDPRTGWLIAVGGAFATSAVAFSAAKGIFHPYYVSFLAPWTAALAGAGAVELARGGRLAVAAALLAGAACEIVVLRNTGALPGLAPWLAAAAVFAAVVVAAAGTERVRRIALGAGLAALLIAPGSWAVQTLGHATNGVFPAGGPAAQAGGGFGGRGGPPLAGGAAGGAAPGAGGGIFGGSSAALSEALTYIGAHGGGTLGVSSQSTAAAAVLDSGADVAGLGGFSGRESDMTVAWLADAVRDGRIRWVLVDGQAGGMPNDGRTGASTVMAAVQATCTATSVDGLYDCAGMADALAAAGT